MEEIEELVKESVSRLLSDLASLYLESNTPRMSIFGMNMTLVLKSDLFKFDLAHYYDNYVRIKVTFLRPECLGGLCLLFVNFLPKP